jgi:hypothetical protein
MVVEYFLTTVVPCIGTIAFFTLVFGFIIILRWFRHREVMTQIQQGLVPGDHGPQTANDRALRRLLGWGLGLAALGLALMIGLYPYGFVAPEPWPLHFGPWMVVGLAPLFIGLALLITYYLSREKRAPQEAEEAQREQAEA